MKNLLAILFFSTCLNLSAQTFFYSGVAKAIDTDGNNTTILFSPRDAKAKHFIVNQNDLKLDKDYYFIIEPKKYKGSKATGKVIFYYEECSQNVRKRNRILDSIKKPIVQY